MPSKNIKLAGLLPGLKRYPQGDFSDDGNHFKAYHYKFLEITYLKDSQDDEIYISCCDFMGGYPEEVTKSQNYERWDDFNGVPTSKWDPEKFKANLLYLTKTYSDYASKLAKKYRYCAHEFGFSNLDEDEMEL